MKNKKLEKLLIEYFSSETFNSFGDNSLMISMDEKIKYLMEAEELTEQVDIESGRRPFVIRKYYDILGMKKGDVHQPIPLSRNLHKNFLPLYRAVNGQFLKTTCYLSECPASVLREINKSLPEIEEQYGYYFGDGSYKYKLYSSPYGVESDIYAVSSTNIFPPEPDTPFEVKLKKLKELSKGHLFYIQDYQPSYIRFPEKESDINVLSFKQLGKILLTSFPYYTFKEAEHILDSILSNYVGAQATKGVDGIGSSYVPNTFLRQDLEKIYSCLSTLKIPIQHFGVKNVFEGTVQDIEILRMQSRGRYKNVSWNFRSYSNLENLRLAEFKYTAGKGSTRLNVENVKELQCQDFMQSLLFLANKDKRISPELHGELMNYILKDVKSSYDKGEGNAMLQMMDEKNLGVQVARISSYLSAFDYDKKTIIDKTWNAHICNKVDFFTAYEESKMKSEQVEISRTIEERTEDMVKIKYAFYVTDRRFESSIVEKMKDICGYTEKKALDVFKSLIEKGLIYFDGHMWRWTHENNLDFKL